MCRWYIPTTIAWSRSYGSRVSCSKEKHLFVNTLSFLDGEKNPPLGLIPSFLILLTSLANTWAAGAVESIQLALMEMTMAPPFLRKWCALRAMIRAWSGWATSAKMTSTIWTSIRYFCGCRASSTMAIRLREDRSVKG